MRGEFIAVEGADGSGKTTQAKRLAAARGSRYITAPSSGEIGRVIRRVLSGELAFPGADALQLLFLADRAEVTETVLKPELARGVCIVADRWSLSGLVYGSVDAEEAGADMKWWGAWYAGADARTLQPDTYIVLDVPADCAIARVRARGGAAERYDKPGRIARVCAGYAALRGYLGARLVSVDGSGSPEDVGAAVLRALTKT